VNEETSKFQRQNVMSKNPTSPYQLSYAAQQMHAELLKQFTPLFNSLDKPEKNMSFYGVSKQLQPLARCLSYAIDSYQYLK